MEDYTYWRDLHPNVDEVEEREIQLGMYYDI